MNADYLVGFFDGEGSCILRIVKDKRYRLGYRVSVKIVFTQKRQGSIARDKEIPKDGAYLLPPEG